MFRRPAVNDYTLAVELPDSILNTLPVLIYQWERNVGDFFSFSLSFFFFFFFSF